MLREEALNFFDVLVKQISQRESNLILFNSLIY